jgi:predicted DNA-binding transcriptional regulator AlpA
MDVRSKYLVLEEIEKSNLPDMFKGILKDVLEGKAVAEESLLLTQQEAYSLLGIGRTSFYNLVKAGAITPVDVGGIPRYRRSDIRSIAEDGTTVGLVIEKYQIDIEQLLNNLKLLAPS